MPPTDKHPPATNAMGELPVATAVYFEGLYLGVTEYNIDCFYRHDYVYIGIEGLDTSSPFVPRDDVDMPCDEAISAGGEWGIHCRRKVISEFPFPDYWDDYVVLIDKESGTGTFHWLVDGLEYFFCIRMFEITEVDFNYEWR